MLAQPVKNLPAMQGPGFKTWVRKVPWKRKWTTHFSIIAWEIPQTNEPGSLQPMGSKEPDMT